jgi:hypothetical protein
MRSLLCVLRFLFSFSIHPLMCGPGDRLLTEPRSDSRIDPDSGRSISSSARERSRFTPAYGRRSDQARFGSRAGILPTLVLFYSLLLFYVLAPRQNVRLAVAWPAALLGTIALELAQCLFGTYLTRIANFNAVYGAFGSIIALLFWIYVSGVIVIFFGCFAATSELARSSLGMANSR